MIKKDKLVHIIISKICPYLIIFLVGGMSGLALLLLVYLLPVYQMKNNLQKDLYIIEEEGDYYNLVEGVKCTQLDNFTDTVMLSLAVYDGEENVFIQAISGNHYDEEDLPDISELYEYLNKGKKGGITSYAWYWHGYLVVLKLLLLITGVRGVRNISRIATVLSIAIIIFILSKSENRNFVLPYIMAILVINPFVVSMSIQYGTSWYVMQIFLLYLIKKRKAGWHRQVTLAFFAAGITVCYFDLLTYPLVVYGIPATYMAYNNRENSDIKATIKEIMRTGIAFVSGYILMLMTKIILIFTFLESSLVTDAISHIFMRLSGEGLNQDIKRVDAITRNLSVLNNPYYYLVVFWAVVALAAFIVSANMKEKKKTVSIRPIVPFVIVACLPFAWYFVLANHSHIHYFFTYRILAVTFCALGAGIMSVADN